MLRKLAQILAVSSALGFSAAYALGLGEISVNSNLNQRFSAVIPLTSVSPEEAENLLVRLADNDDFVKSGIERSDYLSSMNFQVVADAKNPRIVVNSRQIAREPFLSFLLDVRSSTGRVLREYTVLLDPATFNDAAPAPAAAPVVAAPVKSSSEIVATPVVTKPAPAPVVAPVVAPKAPVAAVVAALESEASYSAPATYGPVKSDETFWSIASKLRPNSSVTMDQMLWALYNNNTQAFEGGNINGLRKGSVLKVPSLSTIASVGPTAAKNKLQNVQSGRTAAVATPPPAAVVASAAPAAPAVKAPAPIVEKKLPAVVAPPAPVATPAAAPVAAPAAVAPAPAPKAEVAPGEITATPVTELPPQGEPAPESTPPAIPVEEQAALAEASAEPPQPAEVAPPAPIEASSNSDWIIPAFGGLLVLVLALLGIRSWQKKKAEQAAEPSVAFPHKAPSPWKQDDPTAAPSLLVAKPAVSVKPPPLPFAEKPNISLDKTLIEEAPQKISSAKESATAFGSDDFAGDETASFSSEAIKVAPDSDDPVAEAEFHLAYGLYDEATQLLENAAEKEPNRADIRVKLAETYFHTNKPHEFEDVAQSLKPQLSDAEWQKIAIMGSQLLPDSPLYSGVMTEAALGNDIDLSFDESADFKGSSATKIFEPTATAAPVDRRNVAVLDFELEDIEQAVSAPAAKHVVDSSNSLEFNLSDFDLSTPVAPAKAPAAVANTGALEFDLSGFDASLAQPIADTAINVENINLDDFDLGEFSEDSHAISAGDEAGTKLDLARAYVDMGDNDMARSLLNEVLAQGSDEQKSDAQALIQRLA